MDRPTTNETMYDSILLNDQIDSIYDSILKELTDQNLTEVEIVNALLASTSMGFNDLFNILSRMVVNAYILDKYIATTSLDRDSEIVTIANTTIEIISKIAKSINNDDIKDLTEKLNVLMIATQEAQTANESTTDSKDDEVESKDLS